MKRALVVVWLAACPGPAVSPKNGPDATAADAVASLTKARALVTSFRADSTMDYRFGSQRVKGGVFVMGQPGAKVRINALSPMGGDVIADLACDGSHFFYRDSQHNCELTGPCDQDTIAQLLHVELAPDDFLYLGTGTPPVIAGSAAMTWDGGAGEEHVTITGPDGTQTITIDGKDGHHDVLRSELKGPDGRHVWTVENKDFVDAGSGHRVPGKTRFETEERDNDLIVDWTKIEENVELPVGKFQFALIGLPQCGAKPTAPQPQPAPQP
jgi:hypothetical protein